MDSIVKKSINRGIVGGFLLLVFYFGILSLANSFFHAVSQFSLLWYWILTLVIGFGVQVGLWFYIRSKIKEEKAKGITGEVAATGGISAGSMIACCAHHLIDVGPLLGLSVLFLFLAQYQILFLILGILSNIIGIILMLEIIKKHSLAEASSLLNHLTQFNLKKIKYYTIGFSIILLIITSQIIKSNNWKNFSLPTLSANNSKTFRLTEATPPASLTNLPINLSPKFNDEGGLIIGVTPLNFDFDEPLNFEVSLNTHQGDLAFDLTKKSVLLDDQNQQYLPIQWLGGQGGHHLEGTLTFPPIIRSTKKMKLIIYDVYDIGERIFEWNLE